MKFKNPASYAGRGASDKRSGNARFATNAEAAAGTADDLIVTPLSLAGAVDDLLPDATETVKGKAELSSAAEALSGTDDTTIMTPLKVASVAILGAANASEVLRGIAELATQSETEAYTDDAKIVTPLKLGQAFAKPPSFGSGTPAAGAFTTLAASGLSSLSGSATILTGGTALNLGSDNSADAVNLGVGTTARAIGIGNSAAAHVVTIGSTNGVAGVTVNSGTAGVAINTTGAGDFVVTSADTVLINSAGVLNLNSSAGVINIGNNDVDQNINVGTDGERTVTIGSQNGAAALTLDSGTGNMLIGTTIAKAITIGNTTTSTSLVLSVGTGNFAADGVGASTYTVGASTTTGTISIGGTAQTGTMTLGDSSGTNIVQIGSGEGATTINIAGGATAAKVVNIGRGAVANVITIGSTSAGAIAVDTAAGISLDAATASNFTVSGAAIDLTLQSTLGRVIVKGEEAAVSAVELVSAAGGISASSALQLSLISSEAAVADSVRIQASAADGGIDVDAGTGGIAIDSTGAVSLQGAAASDFSVSGAGIDLDLASTGGRIIATSGEDAADSIYLHADAGTSEKIRIHSDQGTGVDSVELESDVGGITLTSGLASADAINLTANAGGIDCDAVLQVNIASSQAATGAVTLAVSNAAANITCTGAVAFTPDSITSDNAGTVASINTSVTLITTDGDSNEDAVTLSDGVIAGQIKHFAVIAAGNAADSIKITPANMAGGTKITFAADPTGLGCSMVFDGTNWTVFANNGGTIA